MICMPIAVPYIDAETFEMGGIDFEALKKHGYKGGPSVLKVPPPRVNETIEQNWSWSDGKKYKDEGEESYDERERTRAAVEEGARLANVQVRSERKGGMSFSQKEKRKRELGQASRGKSYVEEEKRLLRERGIYSGFDS
ncbi:hypothetical protein AMTRI_Chr03g148630 [Amborella trichopoda]